MLTVRLDKPISCVCTDTIRTSIRGHIIGAACIAIIPGVAIPESVSVG